MNGGSQQVLACISGSADDLRLIRAGSALAERLDGRLTVLYVLAPDAGPRPVDTLHAARLFARSVQAALIEVPAGTVVDGIVQYALERAVKHIVVSQPRRAPRLAARRGSLVNAIAERLTDVEFYVLDGAAATRR
jgi:K+-sensing histidine kinase KdpD